jgi:phage shock protein PspC (stress-responsive transcriptional regulator)
LANPKLPIIPEFHDIRCGLRTVRTALSGQLWKGKILDFSIPESQGVISGDDGNRYTFVGKEWKSPTPPMAGSRVDFDTDGRSAIAIYLDAPAKLGASAAGEDDSIFEGFYRSSDDKMLGGVCAGLAHKWKVSRGGLRFATLLVTLFFLLPLLIYVICWIFFPARPTKRVVPG